MSSLFLRFLWSFLLTILIEMAVAFAFRMKGKDLLLVILVNVLTNPAAVLLSVLTGDKRWVQFLIELVVIFTEGWYYKRYSTELKHGLLFSAAANGISYSLGILINYLMVFR